MKIDFQKIVDFFENKDTKGLIDSTLVYIVLMILLLIVCICALVFFAIFCCCYDRSNSPSNGKTKCYFIVGLVATFAYLAMFITMVIYLGMINGSISDVSCAIATVPSDIIEGVSTDELEFIGFNKLNDMLSSL